MNPAETTNNILPICSGLLIGGTLEYFRMKSNTMKETWKLKTIKALRYLMEGLLIVSSVVPRLNPESDGSQKYCGWLVTGALLAFAVHDGRSLLRKVIKNGKTKK